jgi:bifunctional ADP-heptose synthase (sugar kinase/adenylyltransferase)
VGDHVIVGVYNDSVVNERWGLNLPIMNLNERVLRCVCVCSVWVVMWGEREITAV